MKTKHTTNLGQTLRVLASASDNEKAIGLVVLNRNAPKAITARITWPGFPASGEATVTTLTGDDPCDMNEGCASMDDLRVKTVTRTVRVDSEGMKYTFPPMSLVGITITAK